MVKMGYYYSWSGFSVISPFSIMNVHTVVFWWMDAEPNEWNGIVKKVMEIDNSWNNTAGKYIDVYNSIRVRWERYINIINVTYYLSMLNNLHSFIILVYWDLWTDLNNLQQFESWRHKQKATMLRSNSGYDRLTYMHM